MEDRGCGGVILITFHSVSSALYLRTLLEKRSVVCRIVPVPRELSSSCGYAAEVRDGDPGMLCGLLDSYEMEWEALYKQEHGYTRLAEARS